MSDERRRPFDLNGVFGMCTWYVCLVSVVGICVWCVRLVGVLDRRVV